MLPFIVFCNLLLSLGSRKIILKNGGRKNWKKKTLFKSKNTFSSLFFSLNLKSVALLFI
jgi:photosystem II stability/assembly factor-like uncharacterized protein